MLQLNPELLVPFRTRWQLINQYRQLFPRHDEDALPEQAEYLLFNSV